MSDGVLGHKSFNVPNLTLLSDIVRLEHVADNVSLSVLCSRVISSAIFLGVLVPYCQI